MAITKKYTEFKEMIADVRTISDSLAQSIFPEVQDEDTLRALLLENKQWYNDNPIQRSNYPSITHRCYFTGSGLGFTWHNQINSITCTLHHPSAWHPNSTLLSKAWLSGYRGELPFEYNDAMALDVFNALALADALNNCDLPYRFYEALEAIRENKVGDFLVEIAKPHPQVFKDLDTEFDDDLSDDELLGIKK